MLTRLCFYVFYFFFFQAEDGIRDYKVTGVRTCALPIFVAGEGYDRLQGVPGSRIRVVRLGLGVDTLQLMAWGGPPPGRPAPADARSNDRWFQHVAIKIGRASGGGRGEISVVARYLKKKK